MRVQVGLRRLESIHDRATARSPSKWTPACSSSIAALCLSTCGDTRFDFNYGQLSPATCTCFASSDWTLSALKFAHRARWGTKQFLPSVPAP